MTTATTWERRAPAGTFGTHLARLRERHGLSQMQLAERMDASNTTISRWESGERVPKRVAVDRIADALDLRGDDYDQLYIAAGFSTERIARFLDREFFARKEAT